eukprot:TRINITY_DN7242_c0_g1_i1.p1 TRINITY_DN7242_c0_g1~~TRINITY_DN7242_c0_g1_i1.p1  ORF type:complete len:269 (-),score=41.97 TRINITY_DN7242_c0_g1_i1:165-971(-)
MTLTRDSSAMRKRSDHIDAFAPEVPSSSALMSSSSSAPSGGVSSWDALRKDARRLEHSFEARFKTYADVSVNTPRDVADSAERELEGILRDLSSVQQEMAAHVQAAPDTPSGAVQLERHRVALQAAVDDFRRARETLRAARDRAALLPSVRASIAQYSNAPAADGSDPGGRGGPTAAQSLLLRESGAIGRAQHAAATLVELGGAVSQRIGRQGQQFQNFSGRMQTLTQKFPLVNGIIVHIQRRQRRDQFIMALVCSAGICFLLWWTLF